MVSFREVPYDNRVPCTACPAAVRSNCVMIAAVLQSSELMTHDAPSSGMQRCVVGQVDVDLSKDCGATSHKGPLAAESEVLLSSKRR